MLDLLTSLVDKSLIRTEERGGATRYRLLETVRQYARDRMLESGASEIGRNNHLAYYTKLAEGRVADLFSTNLQAALDLIETEHDNFRASLAWSAELGAASDAGLRIALAISPYWRARGHIEEGRSWLTGTLKHSVGQSKSMRAWTLHILSTLDQDRWVDFAETAYAEEALALFREIEDKAGEAAALAHLANKAFRRGDYADAQELFEKALVLSRAGGKRGLTAETLTFLGNNAIHRGDYLAARQWLEESVAICREIGEGELNVLAAALNMLGGCAEDMGDLDKAYSMYSEALSIRRTLGVVQGTAWSLGDLGGIAAVKGDLTQAEEYMEEALAIHLQTGHRYGVAHTLGKRSRVSLSRGDHTAARAQLTESLTIRRDMGDKQGIADALEGFAELASATNSPLLGARLWGAAQRLREEIGSPLSPRLAKLYENQYAAAREKLGDDAAFEHEWQEGRAMGMDQAVALALER